MKEKIINETVIVPLHVEFNKKNKNERILSKDSIDIEEFNNRLKFGAIKLYHHDYSKTLQDPYNYFIRPWDERIIGTVKNIDFDDMKIEVCPRNCVQHELLKELLSFKFTAGYFGIGKLGSKSNEKESGIKIDYLRIYGFELLPN